MDGNQFLTFSLLLLPHNLTGALFFSNAFLIGYTINKDRTKVSSRSQKGIGINVLFVTIGWVYTVLLYVFGVSDQLSVGELLVMGIICHISFMHLDLAIINSLIHTRQLKITYWHIAGGLAMILATLMVIIIYHDYLYAVVAVTLGFTASLYFMVRVSARIPVASTGRKFALVSMVQVEFIISYVLFPVVMMISGDLFRLIKAAFAITKGGLQTYPISFDALVLTRRWLHKGLLFCASVIVSMGFFILDGANAKMYYVIPIVVLLVLTARYTEVTPENFKVKAAAHGFVAVCIIVLLLYNY